MESIHKFKSKQGSLARSGTSVQKSSSPDAVGSRGSDTLCDMVVSGLAELEGSSFGGGWPTVEDVALAWLSPAVDVEGAPSSGESNSVSLILSERLIAASVPRLRSVGDNGHETGFGRLWICLCG